MNIKMQKIVVAVSLLFLTQGLQAVEDDRLFKTGERCYAHSLLGLRLREGPAANTKTVASIPHGGRVQATADTDKNVHGVFENINGHWVKVSYYRKEGFVFSGFISTFPAPAEYGVKEYALQLNRANLAAAYETKSVTKSAALPAGVEESITLVKANILDGFLIARKLFSIPDTLKLPLALTQNETVMDDPSKTEGAKVRQLRITKDATGRISGITYIEKTEGGGRLGTIAVSEAAVKITLFSYKE